MDKLCDSVFSLFANSRCEIAENPLWNPRDGTLYWKGEHVYRKPCAPESDAEAFETFALRELGLVGGFAFSRDGSLLLFAQRGRVWRWTPGGMPLKIAELPQATDKTFFNDVIADPAGRVFCGVLAENFFDSARRGSHGSLWRLDPDRSLHCLSSEIGACPNGMGFSPDLKRFYFTDDGAIFQYDYELSTGSISKRTPLIAPSGCDGMTVDSEGCLWTAHWSNPLARYSPEGKLMKEYSLPVKAISSVTFGGADFRTLFVTAADYPKGSDSSQGAGGVFRLEQGIRGVPEFSASVI